MFADFGPPRLWPSSRRVSPKGDAGSGSPVLRGHDPDPIPCSVFWKVKAGICHGDDHAHLPNGGRWVGDVFHVPSHGLMRSVLALQQPRPCTCVHTKPQNQVQVQANCMRHSAPASRVEGHRPGTPPAGLSSALRSKSESSVGETVRPGEDAMTGSSCSMCVRGAEIEASRLLQPHLARTHACRPCKVSAAQGKMSTARYCIEYRYCALCTVLGRPPRGGPAANTTDVAAAAS